MSDIADLIAGIIRDGAHPDITDVQVDPSGPRGWCRVRVEFRDSAAVFIGVGR